MPKCIVCLNEFQSKRKDAKMCSPKCRKKNSRSNDEVIEIKGKEKMKILKLTIGDLFDTYGCGCAKGTTKLCSKHGRS